MKKLLLAAVAAGIFAVTSGCSKVPAGYVGVIVNLYGTEKGVNLQEVGTGRYWLTPNEELYKFPTFTQTVSWDGEQSMTFQTVEGMKVTAGVGLTYHVKADQVPALFQKYRAGIDEITNKFMRNMINDAFNEKASTLKVESVYGAGKSALLIAVEQRVQEQVESLGIVVERIYYSGDLGLPPQVTQSLNDKIKATQMAEQRKNEVQQSIAEANKERERAAGIADAALIIAEAEAKAITVRAEALRSNKDIIQLNAIEKWDGKLPTYVGGDAPMPFIKVQ
ncbi:MAG TPA: SPFH domain-containing protein [Pseudomonadales bacterium]|nr:SPFH domain-containing protein [Pseudomonadales bacterium]